MNRSLGLIAAAALAAGGGCARAPGPTAAAVDPASAPIMAGLTWTTAVSGAGAGLTLTEADGTTLLRFACVRPDTVSLNVPRFRMERHEERVMVGLGDRTELFQVDARVDPRVGVEARAPLRPELLDGLASANALSVVYGDQRVGPHIPPDPDSARTFTAACRQIAAS